MLEPPPKRCWSPEPERGGKLEPGSPSIDAAAAATADDIAKGAARSGGYGCDELKCDELKVTTAMGT